jgi:hypothetical protein
VSLGSTILAQAAGNVKLKLDHGNAIITGDDNDNNIMVIQSCCTVIVAGRAKTTVNGNGRSMIEGLTRDIIVQMRRGGDFVRVEGVPGHPVPGNVKIDLGSGDDMLELLGVQVTNKTSIDAGDGNDIVFVDGVRSPNGFSRPAFTGEFTFIGGYGDDLLEFHHAVFRSDVDVRMGKGRDSVCNTEDSQFARPHRALFDGGAPKGFPGDGFVAPTIQLTGITGFEDFPDDCSWLGGRD